MTHRSPLDVYPTEIKTHIHIKACKLMSMEASLAIVTKWTQPQHPPAGGWIDVLGSGSTVGRHLAKEKNQALTRVETGMGLNTTMLRGKAMLDTVPCA